MTRKLPARDDYGADDLSRVYSTCLEIADRLGASLMDRLTVVGGLAPYLLVPPQALPEGIQHVGTLDLDLGLALAASHDPGLYDRIAETLVQAGLAPEAHREGRTPLRWKWPASGVTRVWVDFIPDAAIGGESPWLPEIRFALPDRAAVEIRGYALDGREVSARVWVCSAAPFLLLKAIAFRRRREGKDAHDLHFVLRYYEGDLVSSVAEIIRDPDGFALIEVLRESFADPDDDGPRAVALFLSGRPDDEVQADVAGAAQRVLRPLFLG